MQVLLPYQNLGETIQVTLDLGSVPHSKTGEDSLLIDLSAHSGLVPIQIEAQLPSSLPQAFPPAEQSAPPIEVVASLVSIDGSLRKAVPLTKRKASLYTSSVSIDPEVVTEVARIKVYVVRTTGGSASGFARHKGARIAWSATKEIRLAEKPQGKGGFLKVIWEDFSNSNSVPPEFANAMFYLAISGSAPTLYLNKNVKGTLITLFEVKGYGHAKALHRDILFRAIGANVWMQLAQTSLEDLREEARLGSADLDALEPWKAEVIKELVPTIWPNLLPDAAILDVCTNIGDDSYYQDLLSRCQLAIQLDQRLRDIFEDVSDWVFTHA